MKSGSFKIYQDIPHTGSKGEIASISFYTKKIGNIGEYSQGVKLFRATSSTLLELTPTNNVPKNNFGIPIYSPDYWDKKTLSWRVDDSAEYFRFILEGNIYFETFNTSSVSGSLVQLYYNDFKFDHSIPKTEISNNGVFIKLSPEKYIRMDSGSLDIHLDVANINNIKCDNINSYNIANQGYIHTNIISSSYLNIGNDNIVTGVGCGAIGTKNTSSGYYNMILGRNNTLNSSSDMGDNIGRMICGENNTSENGKYCYAFGKGNISRGYYTTAMGVGLKTYKQDIVNETAGQVVVGSYNKTFNMHAADKEWIFIVGGGNNDISRYDSMLVSKTGIVSSSIYYGKTKNITFHAAGVTSGNNDGYFSLIDDGFLGRTYIEDDETKYYMITPYKGKIHKLKFRYDYPFGSNSKIIIVKGNSGNIPNLLLYDNILDMSTTGSVSLTLSSAQGKFEEGDTIGFRFSGSLSPSIISSGKTNINMSCVWEYIVNS